MQKAACKSSYVHQPGTFTSQNQNAEINHQLAMAITYLI